MPTIRFYELNSDRFRDDPLLLVAKLAEKAFEQGQSCAILARDEAEADALDERLWSFSEDAFVPHQVAGQDDDDECPVLILTPALATPVRAATINLREVSVPQFGDRLLEIIPADPAGKAKARERFLHYRSLGLNPSFEKL